MAHRALRLLFVGFILATVAVTLTITAFETPIPLDKDSPPLASGAIDRDVIILEYESSDGYRLPAVLSIPKGDGPFPVIVTIHGGRGDQSLGYLETMAVPDEVSMTVQMLNEQPWAILAISYRGGAILGMEENDVVAGIRFAKSLDHVDPTRVGVIGGSHGGHLALRAAEVMGNEISAVAAGSPWMTNPQVYLCGDPNLPPLSEISPAAIDVLEKNRDPLVRMLESKYGVDEAAELIADRSIEWNAENIVVPTLFLTSNGDIQVPHIMVQPTIERLQSAGKDVTVYTAEKSLHGFYWGRDVGGARSGLGEKNAVELQEEAMARQYVLDFFRRVFGED